MENDMNLVERKSQLENEIKRIDIKLRKQRYTDSWAMPLLIISTIVGILSGWILAWMAVFVAVCFGLGGEDPDSLLKKQIDLKIRLDECSHQAD